MTDNSATIVQFGKPAAPDGNPMPLPDAAPAPALKLLPPPADAGPADPLNDIVLPVRFVVPSIVQVPAEPQEPKKTPATKPPIADGKEAVIRISTKPPTQDELFRLETEAELRERILQEAKQAGVKLQMTEFTATVRQPLPQQRDLPEQTASYLGNRLCYGRLFFEQPISERFGQSLGVVQPLVSVGIFYHDVAMWPLKLAALPQRPLECNDADAGFVWDRVSSPRRPWWLW